MKLSELEKLAKEATEGQWRVGNFDIVHSHLKNAVGRPFMIASCFSCSGEAEVEHANAAYIAEANPTNILTLCATFREMLDAMKSQLDPSFRLGSDAAMRKAIKKAEKML
jgi:hypothetical protein